MNLSLESLLVELIAAGHEEDYAETARIHLSITHKINILRDRIDELGGYSDDV